MIDVLTDLMQKHEEEVYVIKELFKIHYANCTLLELDVFEINRTIRKIMKDFKHIRYTKKISRISEYHSEAELFLHFEDMVKSFTITLKLKNS